MHRSTVVLSSTLPGKLAPVTGSTFPRTFIIGHGLGCGPISLAKSVLSTQRRRIAIHAFIVSLPLEAALPTASTPKANLEMRTPDPKSRPRNLSLRRREIRDIFLQLGRIQYRKSIKTTLLPVLLIVLVLGVTKMQGQEVFIPDPGLNSAVRDAVEKPTGPLTVQDMLGIDRKSVV